MPTLADKLKSFDKAAALKILEVPDSDSEVPRRSYPSATMMSIGQSYGSGGICILRGAMDREPRGYGQAAESFSLEVRFDSKKITGRTGDFQSWLSLRIFINCGYFERCLNFEILIACSAWTEKWL